jgi:hypothetical protein
MSHRKVAAAILVASLGLVACKASVSIVSVDDAAFREVWVRNWSAVTTHLESLLATDTSPGVCNAGGNLNDCHETSSLLLADLQAFADDLEGTEIPDSYATGVATLKQALAAGIEGFETRMRAIEENDDTAWTDSNELLRSASNLFQQAYAELPVETRPSPPPPL